MKKLVFILVLGLMMALWSGATAQEEAEMDSTHAYVRFAHFAPNAAAVDVTLDGVESDFTSLDFTTIGDWVAVPVGTHSFAIASDASAALTELPDYELLPGTWTTFVVTGAEELLLTPIDEDHSEMLPGTGRITFLNALSVDTVINFNRDDIPFVTDLGVAGTQDDERLSWTSMPVDSGTYDFTVDVTGEPENILGDLGDAKLADTDVTLMALVGTPDDPQLIVDTTSLAESYILRGLMNAPGTIVEAAQADEILQPFADAIETAELTERLNGDGPFTVFAPADYLMDELIAQYGNDPQVLAEILKGYIVEGDLRATDVFGSETLTNLNGDPLAVSFNDDSGTINDSQIIVVNIPATNGTIHIINNLFPAVGE